MRLLEICFLILFCLSVMAQRNLVPNGDFENDANGDGLPDFWTTAGAPQIKQKLVRDIGRDGKGFSGKLICTEFGDGTPASHAMICQVGTIGVQKGKWYRLTLWAKAEDIKRDWSGLPSSILASGTMSVYRMSSIPLIAGRNTSSISNRRATCEPRIADCKSGSIAPVPSGLMMWNFGKSPPSAPSVYPNPYERS